jgi:hypothetical protein
MILRNITDSKDKYIKMMKPILSHRTFAKGLCAAAIAGAGITAGILITRKSIKRLRDELKRKTSYTALTIELHDLDTIKIERNY